MTTHTIARTIWLPSAERYSPFPKEAQWTIPTAINNRGEVVLSAHIPGVRRDAYLWTQADGFRLIAENAVAIDLNERGDVVGQMEGSPFGFIWNAKDGFRDLPLIPAAINEHGDVAGVCIPAGACALVRGVLRVWPCGEENCGTSAHAINARGDVVGMLSSSERGVVEAKLWPRHGGEITFAVGSAEDINNAGLIVGRVAPNYGPAVWTRSGILSETGPITNGVGWGLNARGWVAGVDFNSPGNRAFFWDPTHDVFTYLAQEGSEATDINDRGEIVGTLSAEFAVLYGVIWRVRP